MDMQVITSDGSELACAINATSLALVHAAIPLKLMFGELSSGRALTELAVSAAHHGCIDCRFRHAFM